jgi:hypothetical protein
MTVVARTDCVHLSTCRRRPQRSAPREPLADAGQRSRVPTQHWSAGPRRTGLPSMSRRASGLSGLSCGCQTPHRTPAVAREGRPSRSVSTGEPARAQRLVTPRDAASHGRRATAIPMLGHFVSYPGTLVLTSQRVPIQRRLPGPLRGDVGQRAGTRPSVFSQVVDHFGRPGRSGACLWKSSSRSTQRRDRLDWDTLELTGQCPHFQFVCSFTGAVRGGHTTHHPPT